MSIYTTEYFVERAITIHGTKYTYNNTKYINSIIPLIITCPKHGDFIQKPCAHLAGKGCYQCKGGQRVDTKMFISRAIDVFGGKYGYYNTVYYNSSTKILITCPLHGNFTQIPHSHLRGFGCKKCGELKRASTRRHSLMQFIELANQVHGNFSYDKVKYVNSHTKIIITCEKHGDFSQKPYLHLAGRGCSSCNISHGEKAVEKIINSLGYTTKSQYTFPDCRDKRLLRFDIAIFKNEFLIGLVEYHGPQHYSPMIRGKKMTMAQAEDRFNYTVFHDTMKYQYCESNYIPLCTIPYFKSCNIKNIISMFLCNLS